MPPQRRTVKAPTNGRGAGGSGAAGQPAVAFHVLRLGREGGRGNAFPDCRRCLLPYPRTPAATATAPAPPSPGCRPSSPSCRARRAPRPRAASARRARSTPRSAAGWRPRRRSGSRPASHVRRAPCQGATEVRSYALLLLLQRLALSPGLWGEGVVLSLTLLRSASRSKMLSWARQGTPGLALNARQRGPRGPHPRGWQQDTGPAALHSQDDFRRFVSQCPNCN